jgi:DNA-binding IclR family transcriptional regulator
VRSRGYAVSHGEVIVGAVALAAPTFNHNGEVAGCLGLFGPKARVKDSDIPRFGALVMQAANAVSEQLGYRVEKSGKQQKPRPDRKRGAA